jgi:phosphatidylglycerol:prolipoprotein diacylglycerol transferase
VVGPYVHDIDPVMASVFGVHLWWYGLSYALGFLNAQRFVRARRGELALDLRQVYGLSLLLAGGVLLGGRFVEVVFYEWPFYRAHPWLIPAYWLGGMATHGLLFGGLAGTWLFCRLNRKSFLAITDALAIPAAFILGLGRIGNFIDGQIVGSVTTVGWAVKFPDAEGFRHPVVLYDGLKNLLIIPVLMLAARRALPTGVLTGTLRRAAPGARAFRPLSEARYGAERRAAGTSGGPHHRRTVTASSHSGIRSSNQASTVLSAPLSTSAPSPRNSRPSTVLP